MQKRLTSKIGLEYEKASSNISLLDVNCKLGQLEDLLEKYNLPSVEALERALILKQKLVEECENYANIVEELDKRLYRAIEPNFCIGQTVYIWLYLQGLSELYIESIILNKNGTIQYELSNGGYYIEDQIFATKEDAENQINFKEG